MPAFEDLLFVFPLLAGVQDDAARVLDLLRPPERGIVVKSWDSVRHDPTYFQVLQEYTQLMGWKYSADRDVETQLKVIPPGLPRSIEIPRERVHTVIEALFAAQGFCFALDPRTKPATLMVDSFFTLHAPVTHLPVIAVSEEELSTWSCHSALLVSLVLELRAGERILEPSSFASAFDGNSIRVEAAGESSVRLSGLTSAVESAARLLRDGESLAIDLDAVKLPGEAGVADASSGAQRAAALRAGFRRYPDSLVLEDSGKTTTQERLCAAFSSWSGMAVVMDGHVLERKSIPDLVDLARTEIGADRVYAFVSELMASADCALDPIPAGDPIAWCVRSRQGGLASRVLAIATPIIRLDELAALSEFRATQFQTVVRMPKDDRPGSPGYENMHGPKADPYSIHPLTRPELLRIVGSPNAIAEAVRMLRQIAVPAGR